MDFRFREVADEDSFCTFVEGLAVQLDMLALDAAVFASLPPGYAIAREVLRFGTHCGFSAWLAVENVGEDDMQLVRRCYAAAGRPREALALAKAEKAWGAAGALRRRLRRCGEGINARAMHDVARRLHRPERVQQRVAGRLRFFDGRGAAWADSSSARCCCWASQ